VDLIVVSDIGYHLIPVTKSMLQGLDIPKGVDLFDLCDIIRKNLTTYIESKNIYIMNDSKYLFYGCMMSGAEAPQ
jgi:hypothetical protein